MKAIPPGHKVRDARAEDAEEILRLYHAAYSVHSDPHRAKIAALKDTIDDVRAYLRDSRVMVLEDEGGRIVATVALRRIANVRRLAVAPDLKGDGLGAAMLEAAVEAAREEGFEIAMLDTFEGHPWLPDFYRRHGFTDRCVEHFPDGTVWRQFRRALRDGRA